MPKYRVPFALCEDASCRLSTPSHPTSLARLIGTANAPALIDVRTDEDFAADPRLIPGSIRLSHDNVPDWARQFAGRTAIVVLPARRKARAGRRGLAPPARRGRPRRSKAVSRAWKEAELPLLDTRKLPPRDTKGRTVWVTRARPKIDRIACPWLIRRFVDPERGVSVRGAVRGCRGRRALRRRALRHRERVLEPSRRALHLRRHGRGVRPRDAGRCCGWPRIVRGADTARPDLAPEAPGLLAASLGLSRMYADDLEQLEAGMLLYDAFYRWCRDATGETHNWPTNKAKA